MRLDVSPIFLDQKRLGKAAVLINAGSRQTGRDING